VANLTASRVSTERIRKLRVFQPGEYISLDYSRQDGSRISVDANRQISFAPLPVVKAEPLKTELEDFAVCIRTRRTPTVTGEQALAALTVACDILDRIEEHSRLVAQHVPGTSKS
jgi:predicted dehydrogenase